MAPTPPLISLFLCSFLALLPLSAAQDIAPRGEPFAIAAATGYDAPGGRPGIASDGNNFLAVWKDTRNQATHARDPYAARVTGDGVVLDPNGIRLSISAQDVQWPSVVFDGTHYLVVWTSPLPGTSQYEIFGTIVATDGTVVAMDVPITTTGNTLFRVVSLAHDGTNFLIAWRTSTSQIRATRVSRSGATLTNLHGTSGFLVAQVGGDFYPWVTFGSGQYLIAWHGGGIFPSIGLDIFAARVTIAGVVLDPEGFVVATSDSVKDHVSVATSGSNYLITYRDQASEDIYRNARGYAKRVSPAGVVLDTTPILIAEDVHWGSMIPVVFDGTNYVAIYQVNVVHNARYVDIMGRRISPAGALVDPTPFPIGASFQAQGWLPMFGYGNNRFLAAWSDHGRTHFCSPPACTAGQVFEKLPAATPSALAPTSDVAGDSPADTGWQTATSPIGGAIHSVDALDDSTAWAGTDNTYQLRYNGTSWTQLFNSFTGTDFALWANAPNDVTAVGWGFGPKRFNGTQWIWNNVDAQRGQAQLAQGFWSSGRNNGFIVGTQGRAIRFDGTNWIADPTGVGIDLWDVWGTATNNVYAVGENGVVLHWNGTTWSRMPNTPSRQNLNAIWGTTAANIFVVGDFGTILHFDGVQWTTQASGTTKHLTGVAGLSPTAIFASGFGGTILRYNGVSWQPGASGTTTNLLDVAVGGNTVWAVGDFGVIRRNVIDASECTRSLGRASVPVAAAGGTESVNFSTNCAWRTWSNASWIVLDSSSNGTGDATVSFTVQPNTSASQRTGTLIVGTHTVTVTQPNSVSCSFTLTPTSASHGASATNGSVTVTASDNSCGWGAVSNADWLTALPRIALTGSGTQGYSAAANPMPVVRTGTLTIAGQTFSVTQAGATPGCTFTLNPTSRNHGAGATSDSVTVTASPASCAWTAVSNAPFLSITSGSPGTGSGAIGYSVLANTATASRGGSILIAGITFNVTQAGTTPTPTLQAPTNLVASVAGNTVTTSWAMPPGSLSPTDFVLQGGVSPGGVLASLATGSSATAFTFSAPNGVFFIRIHAIAGSARSAASNEVRIAVNVPLPPAAPTNLAGQAVGSNLSLSWRNQFHEGMPTTIMLDVTGAVSLSMPLPVAESFAFTGVPPGTYTFAVRALNASGSSQATNPVTLTFPGACAAANTPTNFAVTRNGHVISVSWNPPASGPTPTGYVLTVTGAISATIPLTQTSITGAVPPGTYTIGVTATHPCGTSQPTPAQTVVIP